MVTMTPFCGATESSVQSVLRISKLIDAISTYKFVSISLSIGVWQSSNYYPLITMHIKLPYNMAATESNLAMALHPYRNSSLWPRSLALMDWVFQPVV